MIAPDSAAKIFRRMLFVVGTVWALLSLNLCLTVLRFQSNVLTWDQWDFFGPLFNGGSGWELFKYQHGPHRQGLAFVLTSWIAHASNWDTRVESLWIVSLLSASCLLALRLKWRLTGTLRLSDAWMPVLGLSLGQFESFLVTPNASHSAFPLFLILTSANLWLVPRSSIRYVGAGLGAFCLVFTGFGIFAGVVLTCLLVADAIRHGIARRWQELIPAAIGISIAALGGVLFCSDYVFAPAIEGFRFPWTPLTDYLRFISLMLAYPAGLSGVSAGNYIVGGILASLILVCGLWALWLWLKSADVQPHRDVIVLLLGSGVLFVCNAAVGRVPTGVAAGMASRYVTLMFPLWLGVYFLATTSRHRSLAIATGVAVWCVALFPYRDLSSRPLSLWPGTFGATQDQYAFFSHFAHGKMAWVDAYLKTGSAEQAQAATGPYIYPLPAATRMEEKLAFLRKHHLSFFAGSPGEEDFLPWMPRSRAIWNDQVSQPNKAQPLTNTVGLTLAARRAGFVNVRITGPQTASAPLDLEVHGRGPVRTLRLDRFPAVVSVRVERGFNRLGFVSPSGGTTGVLIGPAHWSANPPSNAQTIE